MDTRTSAASKCGESGDHQSDKAVRSTLQANEQLDCLCLVLQYT